MIVQSQKPFAQLAPLKTDVMAHLAPTVGQSQKPLVHLAPLETDVMFHFAQSPRKKSVLDFVHACSFLQRVSKGVSLSGGHGAPEIL